MQFKAFSNDVNMHILTDGDISTCILDSCDFLHENTSNGTSMYNYSLQAEQSFQKYGGGKGNTLGITRVVTI